MVSTDADRKMPVPIDDVGVCRGRTFGLLFPYKEEVGRVGIIRFGPRADRSSVIDRAADTEIGGMRKVKGGTGDEARVAVSAGQGEAGHDVMIPAVVGDGHTDPK